ncbi:MAG: hypothetical protein IPM92_13020 [Saprospiraceae bacterium]|nr:hypothetical protein [Saprospiraceae bacterium]
MTRILVFLLILVSISMKAQSGWTLQKSGLYLKADYSALKADTYYDNSSDGFRVHDFKQTIFNLFASYGLSDRWNLQLHFPLLKSYSFENTEKVSGIGDPRLELKYRFTDNRFPVSISIAPEFPLGKKNAYANFLDSTNSSRNLPLGDGEWNVWTTIAASKSFGKMYCSAFAAFNYRTEFEDYELRNAYQIGLEVGYQALSNLWLNAKIRGQFSEDPDLASPTEVLRNDGTTYTLMSAELFYKPLKNWGVSVTYLTGSELLSKYRNLYAAAYLSFGVVYQY